MVYSAVSLAKGPAPPCGNLLPCAELNCCGEGEIRRRGSPQTLYSRNPAGSRAFRQARPQPRRPRLHPRFCNCGSIKLGSHRHGFMASPRLGSPNHAEDEFAEFNADALPAGMNWMPPEPGAIQLEAGAVPSHNCLRLNENQRLPPRDHLSSAARPSRAALESTSQKNLGFPNSCS